MFGWACPAVRTLATIIIVCAAVCLPDAVGLHMNTQGIRPASPPPVQRRLQSNGYVRVNGSPRALSRGANVGDGYAVRMLRACGWGSGGTCSNVSCSRELPALIGQCQALFELKSWARSVVLSGASEWSTTKCPRNCLLWSSVSHTQCLVWDFAHMTPVSNGTFEGCISNSSTCSERCRRTVVPLVSSCSQLLAVVGQGSAQPFLYAGPSKNACLTSCRFQVCGGRAGQDTACNHIRVQCLAACQDASVKLNATDPVSRIPWFPDLLGTYSTCTAPSVGRATDPYQPSLPPSRGPSSAHESGSGGHRAGRKSAVLVGLGVFCICVVVGLSGMINKRDAPETNGMSEQLLRSRKVRRLPSAQGRQPQPAQHQSPSAPPCTSASTFRSIILDVDIMTHVPWFDASVEAGSGDASGSAWDEAFSCTDAHLGSDDRAPILVRGSTMDDVLPDDWHEGVHVPWERQMAAAEAGVFGGQPSQGVLGGIEVPQQPSAGAQEQTGGPLLTTCGGAGEGVGTWLAAPRASSAGDVWATGLVVPPSQSGQLDGEISTEINLWEHSPLDFLSPGGSPVSQEAMAAASTAGQRSVKGQRHHGRIPVADSGDAARPFKCTVPGCNYTTTQRRYVGDHMHTHTGFKPHKCQFDGCDYRASGTGHLFRHMRVHTGEKPYKCDWPECEYASSQPSFLKIHKRKHTGEKPYQCTVPGCDFTTSRAWYVTRHMRKHKKHSGNEQAQAAGSVVAKKRAKQSAQQVGVGIGRSESRAAVGRPPAPDVPALVMTRP
jgi:hypothetical protein